MAWEGNLWVKLNRPLTDEEKRRQLRHDVPASETPRDNFSVFSMNDVFLESTNALFRMRGMLTYGCLFLFPLTSYMLYGQVHDMTHVPESVPRDATLTAVMVGMGVILIGIVVLFLATLWGFLQENFTWTRTPIRFNRETRMIYAYRGAGAKGVIAVPWDKAFFFVEKRRKEPISRVTPYLIRCHVLDANNNVVQSFSVGSTVSTLLDETTPTGRDIVKGVSDQFEYIRQYMERGPSVLPVPDLVPTQVSLANSMRIWGRTDKAILAERNFFTTLLVLALSPFTYFTALLHYIGQRTSRQPVWPPEVERECEQTRLAEPVRA
ncbi:hypothetical protein NDK50_00090 [Paraburkholderia bryophila]|uniref:DUF6708 domain-containing protein n=1 Tax=Paraburkholderia bryophila TaxID=420952 RepID=UPI00234BC204|nr:DUF6708 domain-containing protein [Paraburkholderia bryophila]WCM19924.1 hypothetical protein NDK50_00090 [Paraburkholderia bryophila]